VLVAVDDTSAMSLLRYSHNGTNFTDFTEDVRASNFGNVITYIYRISSPTASDDAAFIQFDPISSGALAIAAFKVSGLAASPFDVSASTTGTGTNPQTGTTSTTSQASELLVGAIGTEGPDGDAAGNWVTLTAGQRLGTTGGGGASNVTISEGFLVVSAVDSYSGTKNSITSRDWAGAIATYKAKSGAPRRMIQVESQRPQSFGLIKMLFAYTFEKHSFVRSR
jgi:hypothetical protein